MPNVQVVFFIFTENKKFKKKLFDFYNLITYFIRYLIIREMDKYIKEYKIENQETTYALRNWIN